MISIAGTHCAACEFPMSATRVVDRGSPKVHVVSGKFGWYAMQSLEPDTDAYASDLSFGACCGVGVNGPELVLRTQLPTGAASAAAPKQRSLPHSLGAGVEECAGVEESGTVEDCARVEESGTVDGLVL